MLDEELDILVQKWACQQRSYISFQPATCGHHYYSRRILLLRWDLKNIIPLTYYEHTQVHNGQMKIEIKSSPIKNYLDQMAVKDFKSYLLERGVTKEEFMQERKQELLRSIK